MIWVIGGTSDAIFVVDQLLADGCTDILVSTTTDYGSELVQKEHVVLIQKMLSSADMLLLIQQYNIKTVIDASHPFAQEVSANAIKACGNTAVGYIRYERENTRFSQAKYYQSYEQVIAELQATDGNILLTIGSKNVYLFKDFHHQRIIARVLPAIDSFKKCDEAGLKAHQIIAMKGRVNQQTNMALMQEYNIKHLVTKDSGEAGGLNEKIAAADALGITVYILERPKLNYPIVVNNYSMLADKIKSLSNK